MCQFSLNLDDILTCLPVVFNLWQVAPCFNGCWYSLERSIICLLSYLIHVATYLKSWISLHWPCKSHALFLCSPTLLSSSSSAHTFPLSLFGAGLLLQVIGCRGATGIRPQEKKIRGRAARFRGLILDTFLEGPRWPNGSKLEVKIEAKSVKKSTKSASGFRYRFSFDFWSTFEGLDLDFVLAFHI